MFIFFEYTAIVALAALVIVLLFAVSAASLMVEEGFEAGIRMLAKKQQHHEQAQRWLRTLRSGLTHAALTRPR